jgi:hypothetical protein
MILAKSLLVASVLALAGLASAPAAGPARECQAGPTLSSGGRGLERDANTPLRRLSRVTPYWRDLRFTHAQHPTRGCSGYVFV